jgi:hypothetical protein
MDNLSPFMKWLETGQSAENRFTIVHLNRFSGL